MHRFFVDQKLQVGDEVKLPDNIARQVVQVLRMNAGGEIVLFNGDNFDYPATLVAEGKKEVRAKITAQEKNNHEPEAEIALFQALIKKDKLEWVAEKCTEIGIIKIVPVIAKRSVKTGVNDARLRKILKEAAEQSGRARVPEFGEIMTFENALKIATKECEIVYVAHEGVDCSQIPVRGESRKIALFVGPEGGFSDAEIRAATALGAKIISLGSTILRAETAAICGVYHLINGL